jgi:hypothetical protein
MHHIFFCHGLSRFSASRRRTVSDESEPCLVSRTMEAGDSKLIKPHVAGLVRYYIERVLALFREHIECMQRNVVAQTLVVGTLVY